MKERTATDQVFGTHSPSDRFGKSQLESKVGLCRQTGSDYQQKEDVQ